MNKSEGTRPAWFRGLEGWEKERNSLYNDASNVIMNVHFKMEHQFGTVHERTDPETGEYLYHETQVGSKDDIRVSLEEVWKNCMGHITKASLHQIRHDWAGE